MNVLDIGIIILILFGGVMGFKRGFTNEAVSAIGMILVLIFSFLLKDVASQFMYENLPFLNFGWFKNVAILNILFYEFIAFIILFILLSLLLKALLMATSIFEKLLKATIVLSIPSKLLGLVIGLIHYYVITFVILALSMTFIDIKSNLGHDIVTKTPILTDVFNKSAGVVNEFGIIRDKYSDSTISEQQFNYDAIELFLKYDVISSESLQKLIEKDKITDHGYDELINKYKGE